MAHEVIRTEPAEDFYVVWSSVVDDLVAVGGAREVLEFLTTPRAYTGTIQQAAEAMVGRAAAYGGSADTDWDKEYLLCQARALLPRERLGEYARAMSRSEPVEHLLEPLER